MCVWEEIFQGNDVKQYGEWGITCEHEKSNIDLRGRRKERRWWYEQRSWFGWVKKKRIIENILHHIENKTCFKLFTVRTKIWTVFDFFCRNLSSNTKSQSIRLESRCRVFIIHEIMRCRNIICRAISIYLGSWRTVLGSQISNYS